MSSTQSHLKREYKSRQGNVLQIFIAYAIVGFTNILVPSIIFSCSYLIIPFPRGAVILIEALPAVAAKTIFPHLIHYVPYYLRPLFVALSWTLCGIVTWAAPPNVDPVLRVLIVMLASITAAFTDISMLGMLRYCGRPAVTGWGVGTGLGYVSAALLPYIVTVYLGVFLRDALDSLFLLIPLGLWGFSIALTTPILIQIKSTEEGDEADEPLSLLRQTPAQNSQSFRNTLSDNLDRFAVLKPYLRPLYSSLATQTLYTPGFYRASAVSSSFPDFFTYFTAFSVTFQLGNMLGRSSILFKSIDKRQPLSISLTSLHVAFFLNTILVFFSAPLVVFGMAAVAGFVSGALYVNTIDAAAEATVRDQHTHSEFLMGAIGVADSLGVLTGSLTAAVVGMMLCENHWGPGERWCYTPS